MNRPDVNEILYEEVVAPPLAMVLALTALGLVTSLITAAHLWPGLGIGLLAVAATIYWFTRATYIVTPSSMQVWMGFGFPRLTIHRNELSAVQETGIGGPAAGGRGSYGGLTLFNRALVALGGRDGIVLTTHSGRQLQLSTANPAGFEQAASSLLS